MSDSASARPRWASLLLVLLPVWLIASGAAALWYYFHLEKKEALVEQERFVQSVSIPMLEDDLKKIVEVIGERNTASDAAKTGLSRAASMVEGLLGPSNTGYAVKRIRGPMEWPILQVTITGKKADRPVWVITSYDSRPGSKGAEVNGSGLAATLAAAQALAADKPLQPIHFIFLPHVNDPESPVADTVAAFLQLAQSAPLTNSLLCVEAMGAGESLWLSSRDSNSAVFEQLDGIGKVYGAEVVCLGDDVDLASLLFESGVPAVRVATRAMLPASERDDETPSASNVAASTGRLIELIRRSAAK
jgi:hypothetical protein